MKKLRIAIDFDGCIVSENYPNIGVLRNRAKKYITKWYNNGHVITINSCRSGKAEADIIVFLRTNNIPFDFVNENDPIQIKYFGADCRKMGADLHIDDRDSRGFVDWDFEDATVTKLTNSKPLIIAIVGKSGSGKTTWADYMEREFGLRMIQSHTDRLKRSPDENGHIFHTEKEFDNFAMDDMIAFTNFGDRRYCCLKSDLKKKNTYVIDENGLSQLDTELYDVIPIRMHCSRKKREGRIGIERASRDKGRFSWFHPIMLRFSRYDYFINTGRSRADCRTQINKVINKILKTNR